MRLKLFLLLLLLVGCQHRHLQEQTPAKPTKSAAALPFAWPFLSTDYAWQGGNTEGSEVSLSSGASAEWQHLNQPDLSKFERDRRAILALQGDYRVSFQFVETMGFYPEFMPKNPYFSWGTERVHLLEDAGDCIRLQHTLVMYFKDADGVIHGPMVMKHWRQDWQFEGGQTLDYVGDQTWFPRQQDRTGTGLWTQAVYQVDDSPRYIVAGEWRHQLGVSRWESQAFKRPLPRREFSIRDDYQLLEGSHSISLTPTGWVHEQWNRKLQQSSVLAKTPRYLSAEYGLNRYQHIDRPSLDAASDYWYRTGRYWDEVRAAWAEILQQDAPIKLKKRVAEKPLYQYHFEYAEELQTESLPEAAALRQHARTTLQQFLVQEDAE